MHDAFHPALRRLSSISSPTAEDMATPYPSRAGWPTASAVVQICIDNMYRYRYIHVSYVCIYIYV